jgi:hypothetical protein
MRGRFSPNEVLVTSGVPPGYAELLPERRMLFALGLVPSGGSGLEFASMSAFEFVRRSPELDADAPARLSEVVVGTLKKIRGLSADGPAACGGGYWDCKNDDAADRGGAKCPLDPAGAEANVSGVTLLGVPSIENDESCRLG